MQPNKYVDKGIQAMRQPDFSPPFSSLALGAARPALGKQ
jgi:hypothetical protein